MKLLASNILAILEYAEMRGKLTTSITESSDTEELFTDPNAVISLQEFYQMMNNLQNQFNDDLLGIRIGEYSNLKALGLIYQISLNSASVSESLHYLQLHIKNTFPIIEIEVLQQGENTVINFSISNDEALANKVILEYILTVVNKELDMMTGNHIDGIKTSPYVNSTYPPEWQRSKTFSISFDASILNAELYDKNHLHLDYLITGYLKLIEGLKADNTFSDQVKLAILNLADPHLPALETLAETFCLTPRTLQRKLQDENTSYRSLVEDQKKVIAELLLRHDKYSIADIAYLLGFSQPASFIHSFQKWYGKSPEKLRRTQLT